MLAKNHFGFKSSHFDVKKHSPEITLVFKDCFWKLWISTCPKLSGLGGWTWLVTGNYCDPIFARIESEGKKRKMPDSRGVSRFVHIDVGGLRRWTHDRKMADWLQMKLKKAISSRKSNALTTQTRPKTGLVQRLDRPNQSSPTPWPPKPV